MIPGTTKENYRHDQSFMLHDANKIQYYISDSLGHKNLYDQLPKYCAYLPEDFGISVQLYQTATLGMQHE